MLRVQQAINHMMSAAFQRRDLASMLLILGGTLRILLLGYPRHGMVMVFPTQSTDTKRYAFITNACLKYEGICALVGSDSTVAGSKG